MVFPRTYTNFNNNNKIKYRLFALWPKYKGSFIHTGLYKSRLMVCILSDANNNNNNTKSKLWAQWILSNVLLHHKEDISNLALRINHFRNAGAKDAEEFLSPPPSGNRCAWHSTKVVRDTLSYHPLSHQLNTQWKSCSTTSNTWTSERWLSVSPIFDISTRKTPGLDMETKHSILDQFQLWNEGLRQDGRWISLPLILKPGAN